MRAFWVAAILSIATVAAFPAQACRIAAPLRLDDIDRADAIVVGYLSHYEIIRDEAAREQRRRQLQDPNLSPALREILQHPQTDYLSDYARFRINVRETLRGDAPRTLTVNWDNSTFGEPATLPEGEYLVALRRDPAGASIVSVLQSPCSPAFLFESDSAEAQAIRGRMAH